MLNFTLVVSIKTYWVVPIVKDLSRIELLAFDLGHVLRNFESPLVEDSIVGNLTEQLGDSIISVVRVTDLVVAQASHLHGVLGEIFRQTCNVTEGCW